MDLTNYCLICYMDCERLTKLHNGACWLHGGTKVNQPIKKYYIGATHIASAIERGTNVNSTHETLEGAIAEAKAKVRNGEATTCVIVEIIRVVRRDNPPITVDEV